MDSVTKNGKDAVEKTESKERLLRSGQGIIRLRDRINFAKRDFSAHYPDLLNIQIDAYDEFLQERVPPHKRKNAGLQAAFKNNFVWKRR